MKVGNLLFSAVQLVFVGLVFLLGMFFIGLEHVSHLRFAIAQFFLEPPVHFSIAGYLTLSCGGLLLVGFYSMHRGVYYRIKMGKNEAFVDSALIRRYVKDYWDTIFPSENYDVEVRFSHDQKMLLFVEMPLLSSENQKKILEKAEKELGQTLQKHLGFKKDFLLSVLVK